MIKEALGESCNLFHIKTIKLSSHRDEHEIGYKA